MREVFIDLSPDSHLQEVKVFGGYSGEQNETLLKIKLPERMISNDFLYYYFKFETDCNEEILSVPIPYTEITNSIIETPLWQQLTKNGFLKVNVVASNGIITESPSRIAMTNTIVLAIKKSPNGQKVFIDPNAVELQLLQLIDERVLRDLQNLGELAVDQTYTPTSPNAQSGVATAEAVGVANNYTDKAIKSSKTYANNTFAPAIKNTVSGGVLAVHDVSPVEHDLGVSVRSKNLLPYPYYQNSSSANGGTFTVNDDCSITASGIPTAYVELKLYSGESLVKSGKITYRTSGSITNVTTDFVGFDCENNIVFSLWVYESNPLTIDLDSYDTEVTKWSISVKRNTSNTEMSGTFYPQLELGTTATDYTPYVADLSAVGVSRYGKNLITPQEFYKRCYMYEALEYENRNCIKMTSGSTYTISPSFLKPNTQYTVSFWTKSVNFDGAKGPNVVFSFNYSDGTRYLCYSQGDTNNNHNVEWYYTSFTSDKGKTVTSIGVVTMQYQIANYIDTDTFLFEVSDKATEYTPYIQPQTVTANADGTVEGLTSLSPNITVTTDTDGVVIDMTYNADTKMNIDNKIAEISAAIVNKPDEKNLLRVYFANEDTFYVEEGTTITGLFIKFETLRIRGYTNGVWFSKNYAPINIANEIGAGLYTSTSGVTECLKLDDEYGLIFNFTTQQFEYRNRTYIYSKEDNILPIILCEAGRIAYCSPYFVKVMLKNEIAEVKSEISIVNTIPEYWKSALTSAKNKIKTFQNAGGVNEFTFGFISDIHAGSGTSDTMGQLMKNVLEDCDIPVFLDGGDIVSGTGIISKDGLIAEINREKEILAPIEDKCLRALGNHDVAFGVTDNYDSNLTDNEIYSYIFRSNQSKDGFIYGETGTYFYKDVSAQKTRYIVLDCYQCKTSIDENGLVLSNNKFRNPKLGAKQLQWLANVALNVSEGYTIVICTHHPPYRTSDLSVVGWTGEDTFLDCEVALGIVNAYRNKTTYSYSGSLGAETMEETYDISVDFASAVGDIVCWISGHTHKDYIFNLDGLTVVSTANCSPHVSTNPVGFAPSKTSGTDSEYIMDFVCVNKSTRTANIVRLGAELEDNSAGRSFTY